ncbi:MAG: alpha/beta fold hydrolase [Bacteroides sp.]
MKRSGLILLGGLAMLGLAGCKNPVGGSPKTSKKAVQLQCPLPKIENGKFTPDVLWAMGRLSGYAPSQDGKMLAYCVTRYDVKENKGWTDLLLKDIEAGTIKQLTDLNAQLYNVVWANATTLYFVSTHEGAPQIYSIQSDGTNLSRLSNVETGVDGFAIAPDGKHIAYASTIPMIPQVKDKYPDLDKSTGMIFDDLMYRHWDAWDDGARSHIFIAPLENGKVGLGKDIMLGEPYHAPLRPFGGMEEIGWSADGTTLAYTSKKLAGKEAAFSTNSDIYLYNLATEQTRNVTEGNPGYDRCPVFSPDGKYMVYTSMARGGFEADLERLMLLDLTTNTTRQLCPTFDYSAASMVWMPQSDGFYFVSGVRGTFQLYQLMLDSDEPKALTTGLKDYHSVALAGNFLYGDVVSMLSPAEVYRVDLANGNETKVTEVNGNILAQLTMPTVKERWVKTTDGKEMLTWIVLPPNFDSTKTYPALLFCEGGPQSPLTQFWSFRWNLALMASQGYVVVAPNRRGVLTFGQEWTDQISKNHGKQEMQDLLAAIDEVAKEPWIDAERLGAVGASYGGYTVNWLAGHHNKRFKAFISHCGVFHSEMEFYTTEEMFFDEWEMGGKPWEKNNPVAQASFAQSPHKFIENWDTPIMIIHGGNDFRIPYTQGMAAFNAAQIRGIPSRFLFFPDETHWVLKPQNGLLWQREFFRWLDTYLKK